MENVACTVHSPSSFQFRLLPCCCWSVDYAHRNHRLIRDGSPGRPPRLSHSAWALMLPCSWWSLLHSATLCSQALTALLFRAGQSHRPSASTPTSLCIVQIWSIRTMPLSDWQHNTQNTCRRPQFWLMETPVVRKLFSNLDHWSFYLSDQNEEGNKDIYSPVTLKCAQDFVLMKEEPAHKKATGIPLHLNRNKFVVKEWDWLLSLVVIIGYYHWLNISVVIIIGCYQWFWCPSFIRFFFCVWQFSSYFTSVRNKLCPSIMNTTVLCGSFYAPCINFHSFIYSFNRYLSSSVPAIAAMNQHRGLVALHFVSNPHSTRKDHLHQAQCYISNLFVALLLQYITNLNLISLK